MSYQSLGGGIEVTTSINVLPLYYQTLGFSWHQLGMLMKGLT